jgi:peroxiredoxin
MGRSFKATRYLKAFFFISTVLLISCAFAMSKGPEATGPKVGDMATDFSLTSLDGSKVKLSDLRGKVVLLNFFSIGCPPCRGEMPSMQRLKNELAGHDFMMIAINLDVGEFDSVKSFIKENKYNFTVLYDFDGSASYKYMVTRVPTTLIIDKYGKIVQKEIGSRDWADKSNIEQIKDLTEE